MEFDETTNCTTCKYGYFKDFSEDGWHNLCGKDNCYLCHLNYYSYCDDYERGEVPEGKEEM